MPFPSDDDVLLTVAGDLTKTGPPAGSAPVIVEILQQILLEVKTVRHDVRSTIIPKTRKRFKKIVSIIDYGFFFLYFAAVLTFVGYTYDQWAKKYFTSST